MDRTNRVQQSDTQCEQSCASNAFMVKFDKNMFAQQFAIDSKLSDDLSRTVNKARQVQEQAE